MFLAFDTSKLHLLFIFENPQVRFSRLSGKRSPKEDAIAHSDWPSRAKAPGYVHSRSEKSAAKLAKVSENTTYLNHKKIQALIDQQRINLAEVEYLDLDDVAKVMENFDNPMIPEQKKSDDTWSEEDWARARGFAREKRAIKGSALQSLLVARLLNCPQSQLDKIYFDEIGLSGDEASKLTPEQLAQRYAEYKVMRDTPLAPAGMLLMLSVRDTRLTRWDFERILSGYFLCILHKIS